MPGSEFGPERAVERACSGLEQEARSRLRPAHLRLLREALSRNRVDRGFDESGRDPFPVAMALGVARNGMGVAGDADGDMEPVERMLGAG